MERKIKLIWDFRGEGALQTAQHHEIHLKEFILQQKISINITGFEVRNEMYAIAFMVIEEKDVPTLRDVLKPHRGVLYETNNI